MADKKLPEVGSEVEALCTKCKSATVHVVEVIKKDKIAKVMCKSCLSSHKFKSPEDAVAVIAKVKAAPKKRVPKVAAPPKTREERKWSRLLAQVDVEHPIEYTMKGKYAERDVISHNTFGLGVVLKVVDTTKMSVVFQIGVKTLVQNY